MLTLIIAIAAAVIDADLAELSYRSCCSTMARSECRCRSMAGVKVSVLGKYYDIYEISQNVMVDIGQVARGKENRKRKMKSD